MATHTSKLEALIGQAHAALDGPELRPKPTLQAVLASARCPLTNKAVAAALGVHKGSASKMVTRALGCGVARVKDGKHVRIGLVANVGDDLFARAPPARA